MPHKYAQLTDCTDPALAVTDLHMNDADAYVDLSLANMGINATLAATITLPNPHLKAIAVAWANHLAAVAGSMGDNLVLKDKAEKYKDMAELLVKKLTRPALGLSEPAGAGFGQISLGRG